MKKTFKQSKQCPVCGLLFYRRPTEGVMDFRERKTCGRYECVKEMQARSRRESLVDCKRCGRSFMPLADTDDKAHCSKCRAILAGHRQGASLALDNTDIGFMQSYVRLMCEGAVIPLETIIYSREQAAQLLAAGEITPLHMIPRERHIELRINY